MEINDLVFVSVAFGEKYIEQMDRLRESILKIYPNANIMFWRDELPGGSKPFLDSSYGFKPVAIRHAKNKGFQKILWLDPAIILVDRLDILEKYSVAVVRDKNRLSTFIWDDYLRGNGLNREILDLDDVRLVGGSLYYFNFENSPGSPASQLFNEWERDEMMGAFGSQEMESAGLLNGHRADETCMALKMYKLNIPTVSPGDIKYCIGKNPVFIKKHFK